MTAAEAFAELAEDLAPRGVVSSKMFGKPTLKFGTKAAASLHGEALAVKLGAGSPEHAAALALPGSVLFDPSGRGRPMKDWVAVPVEHAGRWPDLALAAVAYLETLGG